jgi:hypothetical protein
VPGWADRNATGDGDIGVIGGIAVIGCQGPTDRQDRRLETPRLQGEQTKHMKAVAMIGLQ